ncbi:LytR C-terminal domain-containing protein [Demequina sp. B12]|uniref:LytR C-terminal domain-containing protein n=1 Tax=Demequina sp. B12 TaxID=2992757 RepID=UPI00237A9009|nr:LytR C-terminal domain-containing protein [Demequina sp. B12]MDE0572282.1 LytR C-terminal domain-containing protein [Demequina sp. B12]
MTDAHQPHATTRGSVTRRRRRERQLVVFGVLIIVLTALTIASLAIYNGNASGPFKAAIHTPAGEFEADTTLVCPPSNTTPLPAEEVVVRVDNATDAQGLAGTTATALESRGFVVSGAQNWSRSYDGNVEILFGSQGVVHAYTLALQFDNVELTLDSRSDITLDLILGAEYVETPGLRSALAPELDPDVALAAGEACLPVDVVEPQLAPGDLPANPLATASPEPSAEPSEGGDE